MARRVEKNDGAVAHVDLVGADVLGDSAMLALRHPGLANRVEERRLTVVDVAHDRDHRSARNRADAFHNLALFLDHFLFIGAHGGVVAEFAAHILRDLDIEGLVDREHQAFADQVFQDVPVLGVRHALRQLLDRDSFGDRDRPQRPCPFRAFQRDDGNDLAGAFLPGLSPGADPGPIGAGPSSGRGRGGGWRGRATRTP